MLLSYLYKFRIESKNILLISILYSLFIGISAKESKRTVGVWLKLLNAKENKFLGRTHDNNLGIVNFDSAVQFNIEETKYASEKVFLDLETMQAPEKMRYMWDGWRKKFEFRDKKRDKSDMRFRLSYFASNDFVLMQGDDCLGVERGILRSKSCDNPPTVAHFAICKSKKECMDSRSLLDVLEDVKAIERKLMGRRSGGSYNRRRRSSLYNYDYYPRRSSIARHNPYMLNGY